MALGIQPSAAALHRVPQARNSVSAHLQPKDKVSIGKKNSCPFIVKSFGIPAATPFGWSPVPKQRVTGHVCSLQRTQGLVRGREADQAVSRQRVAFLAVAAATPQRVGLPWPPAAR